MALLWPACGPDLANRSGPPKGRHSLLHVGQIHIPQVPDLGRIWPETMLLSGKKTVIMTFGRVVYFVDVGFDSLV